MSKKLDEQKAAAARRLRSIEWLAQHGRMSYNEHGKTGASLEGDLAAMNSEAGETRYVAAGGWILDQNYSKGNVSQHRKDLEAKSKKLVADLVCQLIVGSNIRLQHKMLGLCGDDNGKKNSVTDRFALPFDRLRDFWRRGNRAVVLDAGSTNSKVAEKLFKCKIPSRGGSLESLTVASNSIDILSKVGAVGSRIRAQSLGGNQELGRAAMTGELTIWMLENAPMMHWDMAVIGAFSLDTKKMEVLVDNYYDMKVKAALLDRSNIRVIAVDSTKLNNSICKRGIKVTDILPECVDIIVTNTPLVKANIEAHKKALDAIYARGVIVLESDKLLQVLKS